MPYLCLHFVVLEILFAGKLKYVNGYKNIKIGRFALEPIGCDFLVCITLFINLLRKVIGIKWQDKVTNLEVLDKSGQKCIDTIIGMKRLKWLGHIERVDDQRIPKQVLYGESEMGKRKVGRPKLRYIDQIKSDMKTFNIDINTWQRYS